jgi:hypothetical protein
MSLAGNAPYIGEFDSCLALGEFLEKCVNELESGNDEHLQHLWYIFAPTCDWDDAGGSQDIGNAAFGILDRIGRPAAMSREPQLWVFVVLAFLHVSGIISGFQVWYFLGQPGKDPLAQLRQCGPVGVGLAGLVYVIYHKRTWHMTLVAALVAFALGAVTGLTAVVMHLTEFGWY